MSSRSALLVCLLLLSSLCRGGPAAQAQSFRSFNGRNHPEIDWRVAETEHFEIVYPARLAGIEAQAAPIAEQSWDALSANLGITPQEPFTIYLSDQDEIANGFATPLSDGYTQIWVNVNDIASTWTGREKWLRKVIAHELVHLFHYRAVESDLGLLGIPGATPSFWAEGLAQYETEQWDAQRGDRWLRTAVLADQLSYADGRSIRNGRLLYAVGNSQVRYLAATQGDSTLQQILAYRDTTFFGLLETASFTSAFEEATGKTYEAFYEDWRRYVNVYYNSLAGQLPTADSLVADSVAAPLSGLPGQYLYDLQPAPGPSAADSGRVAVLSVLSPARPLRRLYVADRACGVVRPVAEGAIRAPVSWVPARGTAESDTLLFARTTRAEHGSLVNDLFRVAAEGDLGDAERLTYGRRASSPAARPGQPGHIAFVGAKGETANIFLLNTATGRERQLTDFTGDVQISALTWHPGDAGAPSDLLAFSRFTSAGVRDVALLDVPSGRVTPITAPGTDNRVPVFAPGGHRLAYTSLRDDVPNVFTYELASGTHQRVTHLAEGATAYGWLAPDSAHPAGQLAAVTAEGKARDRALLLDASHAAPTAHGPATAPPGFSKWTTTRPPQEVASRIAPDASLVASRRAYSSWSHVDHVASLALPFYLGGDRYGVAGGTAWREPLGQHTLLAGGALVAGDPAQSAFYAAYRNNQFAPTLSVSAWRFPEEPQGYGRRPGGILFGDRSLGESSFNETTTTLQLEADWPLDVRVRPYTQTRLETQLSVAAYQPLDADDLDLAGTGLSPPEDGQEVRLEVALGRRRLTPNASNFVHPLDGHGWRVELSGAAPLWGADSQFLRADVAAFRLLPGLAERHRLYLYGRLQAQTGDVFAQDYMGLRRTDADDFRLPPLFYLNAPTNERVRGYRSYTVGNRVAFATAEYRVPLTSSLQTELLGLVRLGATSAALFADGGAVWDGAAPIAERLGVGAEIKNEIIVTGGARIGHALGVAQPADRVGTYGAVNEDYRVYYRIRAAVPF